MDNFAKADFSGRSLVIENLGKIEDALGTIIIRATPTDFKEVYDIDLDTFDGRFIFEVKKLTHFSNDFPTRIIEIHKFRNLKKFSFFSVYMVYIFRDGIELVNLNPRFLGILPIQIRTITTTRYTVQESDLYTRSVIFVTPDYSFDRFIPFDNPTSTIGRVSYGNQ